MAKRINEIVNRLNKTERREEIDYRGEREERDAKERQKAVSRCFLIFILEKYKMKLGCLPT